MSLAATPRPTIPSLADVLRQLGSVSPERIPSRPPLGCATEEDVLVRTTGEKRLYELVDGVLVEKAMGYYESRVAVVLARFIEAFLETHDLGIVLGADGTLRLAPGLVRAPDVSFIAWERFPGRVLPSDPIPDLVPDLAVEVLSEGNTPGEMDRKLREYFEAGCRLVWYVDAVRREVRAYTSPDASVPRGEAEALEGGDVLPGFSLSMRTLFERAGRRA